MATLAALPPVTQGPEPQYDIFLNGLNNLMDALNGKVATPITIKGQVLNVMGYGAFSDGSNADATTKAIQAAIDDLPKGSYGAGTVYFPPGVYSINAPLKVGRSMAATTISFTAPNTISDSGGGFGEFKYGDVITIRGSTGGLNDTAFDVVTASATVITVPSGVTTQAAGPSIVASRNNTACRFQGCGWGTRLDWRGGNNQAVIHFMTNWPTTLPLLDGVYDLRISNSIAATGMVGIKNGASNEATNRNNTKISGVQVDGVATGIQLWSGIDIIIIENCRILDVTDAITFAAGSVAGAMDTITINECTFAGVSGWAIDGASGGNYRVLHNFFSSIEKGIRFDSFDSVQITNNEMEITLGTAANRRAISLGTTALGSNSMSGVVIDANHINLGAATAGQVGIYLNYVKGVHLHGNSFTNVQVAIQTTANANSVFIGQQAWGTGVTTKLTYDNASRPVVMDETIGYAIRSPLNQDTLTVHATHTTFTNNLIYGAVERADSALFWLFSLVNATGTKFTIRGDGDIWAPTTAPYRAGITGEVFARMSKPSSLVTQLTHNAYISGGLWYPDEGAVGAGARGYSILQLSEGSQYGRLFLFLGQVTAVAPTDFTPTLALTIAPLGLYPAGDIFHNNGYGVKGLTNGLAPNVYVTLIYLDSNNDCNLDAYTGRFVISQKDLKVINNIYPGNQATNYLGADATGLFVRPNKLLIGSAWPAVPFALSIYGTGVGAGIMIENPSGAGFDATIYVSDTGGLKFRTQGGNDRVVIGTGGLVQMTAYGAGTATFDASGNISSVSDERLKTLIRPLPYGLAEILKLEPIAYHYVPESGLDTEHEYGGFGALALESVIPLAIGKDSRGYRTLADRPILGAVVNAVKEHNEVIQAQAQRIAHLEAEVAELERR